jgi:ribosomal protein L11 methyltransferase
LWHALRPGDAVLDLGTGSGVLAIAAASWGAGSVTALDIDPTCATSIAANLALNALAPERVRFVTADATRWEEAGSAWHIVLANLAATDLSRGLSRWSARLTAGGALVGSGIWHASAGRLRSLAETERLTLVSDEHDEGWHTLVWRK